MVNHNQDSYPLTEKYERRAKIAAWMVGLSMGIGAIESVAAQAAGAGRETPEVAAQSPQEFIVNTDTRLAKLVSEARSIKYIRVIHGENPLLNAPANVDAYFVAGPGSSRGRYNLLSFVIKKGQKYPLITAVTFDATSILNTDGNGTSSGGMVIYQNAGKNQDKFTPDSISLQELRTDGVTTFQASTNSTNTMHQSFVKSSPNASSFSPVQSSVVARHFDSFFNSAKKIIESNSH